MPAAAAPAVTLVEGVTLPAAVVALGEGAAGTLREPAGTAPGLPSATVSAAEVAGAVVEADAAVLAAIFSLPCSQRLMHS